MTQEEKAKRLDEIIKKIRGMMPSWERLTYTDKTFLQDLTHIIPELQESEGEKIRKSLIALVTWVQSYSVSGVTGEDAEAMLNWLEMQSEHQKPAHKEYTFTAIPRLLEMIQPTDRAKSYCQKLIDSLEQEGYSTDAKIVRERLKLMNGEKVAMATMDEQKPADWSEEDSYMLGKAIRCVNNSGKLDVSTEEIEDWLKNLKPQPKQEWSEEDEKMIRGLIVICDEWTISHSFYPIENGEIEKLKKWLKSLKGRVQPQDYF